MNNKELNEGIQDWLSIIDYSGKEQTAWRRRNITELRKNIEKKIEKEKNN